MENTLRKKYCGEQPVIHRYKKARARLCWLRASGMEYKKFKKPENLTIVTVHNYEEKSIFEESLDFLGVSGYVVLRHRGPWRHMLKFKLLLDYLDSGRCNTDYLMFCDARDTVLSDDPSKIVPLFLRFNCRMVTNATLSTRGIYRTFPTLNRWARRISKTGNSRRLINSGAYIGYPAFIADVMRASMSYYDIDTFPADQDVLRGIHPWFHPQLKVDYYNDIFYRN